MTAFNAMLNNIRFNYLHFQCACCEFNLRLKWEIKIKMIIYHFDNREISKSHGKKRNIA